jgi:hypothetical protein
MSLDDLFHVDLECAVWRVEAVPQPVQTMA